MISIASHRAAWAAYQTAWEAIPGSERQELLAASVAEDCIYLDPVGEARGRDVLIGYIEQFRQATPAGTFRNQTFVAHHEQSMATWTLVDGGDAPQTGASHARFDDEGRMTSVIGFFVTPGVDESRQRAWKDYQAAWRDISPGSARRCCSAASTRTASTSIPWEPSEGATS